LVGRRTVPSQPTRISGKSISSILLKLFIGRNDFYVISVIQVPDVSVVYDSDKVSINSSVRLVHEKLGDMQVTYFAH
jgi:hypothetical protein